MLNVDINVDRQNGRMDGRTENRTPISHPATSRCDKNEFKSTVTLTSVHPDQLVHLHSLIRVNAVHQQNLLKPYITSVNPDQTLQMLVTYVITYPDGCFSYDTEKLICYG